MSRSLSWKTALAAIAFAIAAALLAIPIWTVYAQSSESGAAPTAPMGQMMHGQSPIRPDSQHMNDKVGPKPYSPMSEEAHDSRQFVSLPAPMQEHMLTNMRDHLETLNTVIGDVAEAKFDAASKLLEERLGMSSLPLHHAAEMAPYFPQPMQDAGTSMHHAASRLAIALQDVSVTRTFESLREVDAALHEVTSACVACHAGYRVH